MEDYVTMRHTLEKPNIRTALYLYQKHCYTLAPRTRQIYGDHLTRLYKFLGDISLSEIDHFRLTDFMAGLTRPDGSAYAPGYLSQIYRSCYTFFQYCLMEGWLEVNPLARVPRPRQPSGPKKRLKINQVAELLAAVQIHGKYPSLAGRNLAIVLLMVDSGLRLNEVASLQIEDFDPIYKSLWVTSQKTHLSREVPLHPKTVETIIGCIGDRKNGPIFLARSGGGPVTANGIASLVKRLQQRLSFKLHPHLLRHTFANLYNKRGDIRKLQKILGHSDIRTTARYYSDPDFEDIQLEHREVSPLQQLKNLTP